MKKRRVFYIPTMDMFEFLADTRAFVDRVLSDPAVTESNLLPKKIVALYRSPEYSDGYRERYPNFENVAPYVVMILVLVLKPNGIFSRGRSLPPEPLTGTFIAPSAPLRIPVWLVVTLAVAALVLPVVVRDGYVLQTLGIGWLYAVMAISLTLVAGTAGMI